MSFSHEAAEKALLKSTQLASFVAGFAGDLENFRVSVAPAAGEDQPLTDETEDGEEDEHGGSEGAALKTDGEMVGSQP